MLWEFLDETWTRRKTPAPLFALLTAVAMPEPINRQLLSQESSTETPW